MIRYLITPCRPFELLYMQVGIKFAVRQVDGRGFRGNDSLGLVGETISEILVIDATFERTMM